MENAASRLFSEFKRAAELHLRSPVKGAVVATPVYFGTPQRDALRRAAEAAGLQVIRMTHEPSAILSAYALGKGSITEAVNVAVVDFGAGSLQVTVATIEEGVVDTKSVLGTPEVGGDIIDLRLLDFLITKFNRTCGIGMLYIMVVRNRILNSHSVRRSQRSPCPTSTSDRMRAGEAPALYPDNHRH
jgi:molecular chaperone DnaK (HSP70)